MRKQVVKNRVGVVNRRSRWVLCLVVAATFLLTATQASAFRFNAGKVEGSLDVTLGYAAAYSTEEGRTLNYTNTEFPAATNLKGDETYRDKGIVSQVWKIRPEFELIYGNYGLKLDASYSYDYEIMNKDRGYDYDFDGINDDWSDKAKDASGSVFTQLNGYVYGTFMDNLDARAGYQVINWGEGLIFGDGVSVQSPLNINNLVLPGAELKEAYLPLGALRGQLAATDELSLDAYWQWDWQKSRFPGTGTFYGEDILAAPGAEQETLAWTGGPGVGFNFEDREEDVKKNNQWGLSGTYFVGDYEFGLYYSRYNDSFPMPGLDVNTFGTVYATYAEDQDMYGASVSTNVGAWSINGEVSYRPDRTVMTTVFGGENFFNILGIGLNGDGQYWTEADTANAAVHGLWLGKDFIAGIDSQFVLIQLGVDYINYDGDMQDLAPMGVNHKAGELVLSADGTKFQTPAEHAVTDTAWGIAAGWDGTWLAIYPNVDLTLSLFGQYDFAGISHGWGNFAEGRLKTSYGLTANIGDAWETGLSYNRTDHSDSNYDVQNTVNFMVNYKF